MDNSNTNWPNNPSPTPNPTNGTPSSQPVAPPTNDMTANNPLDTTPAPPVSQPDFSSAATPASTWTPPPQPVSTPPVPQPAEPNPSTWPSMPSTASSFGTSPLDNPWGAPAQAPAIDGNPSIPQSTWPTSPSTPSPNSIGPEPTAQANPTDSIPTDLSHLISNNPPAEPAPTTAAETLVVPPAATPEVPNITAEGRKGIPMWLIGVGIGLLIIVAGASAYFILGIGQPPKTTTSVPAEVTNNKPTVKTPPPIATPPQATPAAVATGSANFGQLQGNATASPQATSAAELLKQRQQAR